VWLNLNFIACRQTYIIGINLAVSDRFLPEILNSRKDITSWPHLHSLLHRPPLPPRDTSR
jgi:hypothetical protein